MEKKIKRYDEVNRPKHYCIHPSGVEPIEIEQHMTFLIGSAFKYCFRARYKGKFIQDIDKAIWCLKKQKKQTQFFACSYSHKINEKILRIASFETITTWTHLFRIIIEINKSPFDKRKIDRAIKALQKIKRLNLRTKPKKYEKYEICAAHCNGKNV